MDDEAASVKLLVKESQTDTLAERLGVLSLSLSSSSPNTFACESNSGETEKAFAFERAILGANLLATTCERG